jgi:hypothetical protein
MNRFRMINGFIFFFISTSVPEPICIRVFIYRRVMHFLSKVFPPCKLGICQAIGRNA